MEYFTKIKDVVNSYVGTDAEKAIIEATSTESWGCSNSLKKQIVGYTHHHEAYDQAVPLLFKRLEVDFETATIVIFKALELIYFMLSNGASNRFANDVRRQRYSISKWVQFSYNNGEKDYSSSIRQASTKIMDFLDNPQGSDDQNASQSYGSAGNVSKYGGMGGSGGSYGGMGGGSSHSYDNYSRQQPSHQYNNNANNGNQMARNQSKYGGQGHAAQPPAATHRADEFISHDQDINVHGDTDPFTQQPTRQAQQPQQKRTIGQAATSQQQQQQSTIQKPKMAAAQPKPAQISTFDTTQQNDPFADVANSTIVVSQTTEDPFADAAGDFDDFSSNAASPAAAPSQPAPAPIPAPENDVFALLGATDPSAAHAKPQTTTDSLLSLYNQPAQQQPNGFDALYAQPAQMQQAPQQQQQQQQQQQPFDMWGQTQQQQPQPQQMYNPYEMASQQNNQMFGFNNSQPTQQQKPPQQQHSTDPFADIFATSAAPTTTQPKQQQQSSVPTPSTGKKDPFDFDF